MIDRPLQPWMEIGRGLGLLRYAALLEGENFDNAGWEAEIIAALREGRIAARASYFGPVEGSGNASGDTISLPADQVLENFVPASDADHESRDIEVDDIGLDFVDIELPIDYATGGVHAIPAEFWSSIGTSLVQTHNVYDWWAGIFQQDSQHHASDVMISVAEFFDCFGERISDAVATLNVIAPGLSNINSLPSTPKRGRPMKDHHTAAARLALFLNGQSIERLVKMKIYDAAELLNNEYRKMHYGPLDSRQATGAASAILSQVRIHKGIKS